MGDIDWSVEPPHPINSTTAADMNSLLDLIEDNALTQHVTEPTRPASGKTLDLVLSSSPTLVSNVKVVPGMSDHDIVTFDINAKPHRALTSPHKVYLYKKMDSEGLHADLTNLQAQFFQSNTNRSVEINWSFFKSNLLASVEARIPSKMTKSKF